MQKRHHTVPRCYLENFTDKNGYVWVLDTSDKIFNIRPENILVETHFYRLTLKNGEKSVVVEDTLANMEGAFADIFANKISKGIPLTVDERAKIAIFTAAMLHRTRPHRESMRNMFERLKETMQEWQEEYRRNPEARELASIMPSSGDDKSITLEELDEGLKDFDEQHAADLIPQIVSTAQIIFDMKWAILKRKNGDIDFITSDDPFVVVRPESIKKYGAKAIGSQPGLIYKDAEVSLPLSKDLALLAGWTINEDCYIDIPAENVEPINQRTALHSGERIVASSKEQLEIIKTKYPPRNK